MDDRINLVNPGRIVNIWNGDSLTQVQHKGDRVEIVDHMDKGNDPVPVHFVTRVDKDGSITTSIE